MLALHMFGIVMPAVVPAAAGKPPVLLQELMVQSTGHGQFALMQTSSVRAKSRITSDRQAIASKEKQWLITMSQNRHVHAVNHSAGFVNVGMAPGPTAEDAANESEKARPLWQNMLIFFGMSGGIFIGMLLVCSLLQALVRGQRAAREQLMNSSEDVKARRGEPAKPLKSSKDDVTSHITEDEFASFVNGDHVRFELLLDIASSARPDTAARELVQKAANSSRLKLSDRSVAEAVWGLREFAKIALKMNQKRDPTLGPKGKLQKAVHDVRMMLKFSRHSVEDKAVHSWTSDQDHSEHHSNKYSDGHTDALHRSQRLSYFSSERWLDHAAIVFIVAYGQVCAIAYAAYLKWRFPLMYAFMGPWLLVSRGEAMAIIIYTIFMVLLMCRRLLTCLRSYMLWSSVLGIIVDKHVLVHRASGVMIVVSAVLHILGHLKGSIPAIIYETDNAVVNKAFTYGTKIKFNFNSWTEAAQCYPAVTGYVLIFLLCLFWASSNVRARLYSFELFHYLHLSLIVMWTIGLAAHGARQWLGIGVPLGLVGVAPVVVYYVIERIGDIQTGISPTIKISHAVITKRTVLLEIDTGSSGFSYETGMYCMLKVPTISEFQWHPFTIASAGNQHSFQVLFAVVGDWTTQLQDLLKESQRNNTQYPEICIRGGYGAPAESMKDKRHIVMVGAGVGATPFLSFLSNICSAAKAGTKSQFDDLCSAVFYWVTREPEDFVWVNHYISVIQAMPSLKDRVSVRLCLSKSLETSAKKGCSAAELALFWLGVQTALRKVRETELSKELGAPTQFGRPNWEKEFQTCADEALEHQKKTLFKVEDDGPLEISVFACGNKMLIASLEEACENMTDDTTAFRLFAEEF
mmetsp:Transcript_26787/g.49298  ORF Transcript_26787/g.49298 Transcript_26787/m.49298 type:complete len:859 (+) Transcript_26787:66-2642(+)